MVSVGGIDLEEASQLLKLEARLLDERRFQEWEALFAEEAYYWIPLDPGQESPYDDLSIIYDDRQLMRERIRRLGHPRVHVDTPKRRTVHFISNIELVSAPEREVNCVAESSVLVVEYRSGDPQRFFAGRCKHGLLRRGDALKLAFKRFDLINRDDVFDPIVVPL